MVTLRHCNHHIANNNTLKSINNIVFAVTHNLNLLIKYLEVE